MVICVLDFFMVSLAKVHQFYFISFFPQKNMVLGSLVFIVFLFSDSFSAIYYFLPSCFELNLLIFPIYCGRSLEYLFEIDLSLGSTLSHTCWGSANMSNCKHDRKEYWHKPRQHKHISSLNGTVCFNNEHRIITWTFQGVRKESDFYLFIYFWF